MKEFEDKGFVKARIVDIANEHGYYVKDLENLYEHLMFSMISEKYKTDFVNETYNIIIEKLELDKARKKYINKSFFEIYKKTLYLAMKNGFTNNYTNVESGLMMANSGDSAQFLFVGRAILAGFNCSNVDVRSSRYDAIIDYGGKLLKVQIKGISADIISFWDMPRGGVASNHTHPSIRIRHEDCDVYVAVDKQVGICYIIPMEEVESWSDDDTKRMSVDDSRIVKYKENWDVISQTKPYIRK